MATNRVKGGAPAATVITTDAPAPAAVKTKKVSKKPVEKQSAPAKPAADVVDARKPRAKAVKPDAAKSEALNAEPAKAEAAAPVVEAVSVEVAPTPTPVEHVAAEEVAPAGPSAMDRLAAIRNRTAQAAADANDPLARMRGTRSIPQDEVEGAGFGDRLRRAASSVGGWVRR